MHLFIGSSVHYCTPSLHGESRDRHARPCSRLTASMSLHGNAWEIHVPLPCWLLVSLIFQLSAPLCRERFLVRRLLLTAVASPSSSGESQAPQGSGMPLRHSQRSPASLSGGFPAALGSSCRRLPQQCSTRITRWLYSVADIAKAAQHRASRTGTAGLLE